MKLFHSLFGDTGANIRCFFAPGRVNLIGEHLDYNGGWVLPFALERGVRLWVRLRSDGRYRYASTAYPEVVDVRDLQVPYCAEDGFANYPKGVLATLNARGLAFSGWDCLYDSDLAQGAGLSSSAAVEVVTAYAAITLTGHSMSRLELARCAQASENNYVGVQCGIMDQYAVTLAKTNHALLIDCQTEQVTYVPMNLSPYTIVIMNSNKDRQLADSAYNRRRWECQTALDQIRVFAPQISALADLDETWWQDHRSILKDSTLVKRVDHVVGEQARVLQARHLLETGDIKGVGRLLSASHVSLANNFEVSSRELDALVDAAIQSPYCVGARLTGAGFGGSAIALVKEGQATDFCQAVEAEYKNLVGHAPTFYEAKKAGDGVRELTPWGDKA